MSLVMVGVESEERAAESSRLLAARGFQTTQVPLTAVPQAIEATARAGGRIDAVVLPAALYMESDPEEVLGVGRKIRALDGLFNRQ